jgi:hypothetical protein
MLLEGVWGEAAGDGSVIEDPSRVETVVVGEESDDSEAEVETLSRCWWKGEYCALIGLKSVCSVVGPLLLLGNGLCTSDA